MRCQWSPRVTSGRHHLWLAGLGSPHNVGHLDLPDLANIWGGEDIHFHDHLHYLHHSHTPLIPHALED